VIVIVVLGVAERRKLHLGQVPSRTLQAASPIFAVATSGADLCKDFIVLKNQFILIYFDGRNSVVILMLATN